MESGQVEIRGLRSGDKGQWAPLWRGYQEFYGVALSPELTDHTWAAFMDPAQPVHALGAFAGAHDAHRLVGIAHYLFHRSTWMIGNTCYLQDLFVLPAARRHRIGRRLIEAVYAAADQADVAQVYWLTHKGNFDARKLYDGLAKHAGFILYERFSEVPDADA